MYLPPPDCHCLCAGKKTVTLEIYTEQRTNAGGVRSVKRRSPGSSGLELKLDELRKELSYAGGILPHSVLSMEQISLLSSQKPNSLEQASFKYVWICSVEWIKMKRRIAKRCKMENYETNILFHYLNIFVIERKKLMVPYFHPIPHLKHREETGKCMHDIKFLSISLYF